MIVSNNSVNAIALPYVWQLTDNYGYTHYYLQTNTLSQTVTIHSWPDFDDLPRGQPMWERGQGRGRGQILRGRGQKIWPWGRVGLEDLTSPIRSQMNTSREQLLKKLTVWAGDFHHTYSATTSTCYTPTTTLIYHRDISSAAFNLTQHHGHWQFPFKSRKIAAHKV